MTFRIMVRILTVLVMALCLVGSRLHASAVAGEAGCSTPGPIDETFHVEAAGAKLYLLVRGERCDLPVMLWLHGGPGGAETPLFRLYDSELERDFLVAYWDQRGAGRSYDRSADPSTLTVARHLADLDLVIDHLRERFGQQEIALVGHSWGSALGLLYASEHPEKVAAIIGVNQFVSGLDAQWGKYRFAAAEARRRGDGDGRKELERLGPPPLNAQDELHLQALVDRYGGYFRRRPSFLMAIVSGTLRGYAMPWEIPAFIRANEASLAAMQDEVLSLDLRERIDSVEVPVVFMLGRYDRQLDAGQALSFFDLLDARWKRLIWFEESAHNIPFEQPEAFVETLNEVLKEAAATKY